ncbi:hypothetical protein D3C84_1204260 [compost metagenome]
MTAVEDKVTGFDICKVLFYCNQVVTVSTSGCGRVIRKQKDERRIRFLDQRWVIQYVDGIVYFSAGEW